MKKIFTVLLIVFFILYTSPFYSLAQTGAAKMVEQGIQYYHEARFEDAVDTLENALKFGLNKQTQIKAHLYLAVSYTALTQAAKTKQHLLEILRIDKDFSLRHGDYPAEVINIVREANVGIRIISPPSQLPQPRQKTKRMEREIMFKSGSRLKGFVVSFDKENLVFETAELGRTVLKISQIKNITPPVSGLILGDEKDSDTASVVRVKKDEKPRNNIIEKKAAEIPRKKRKKIPHFLIAAAVVIIAVIAILITANKDSESENISKDIYHLTVEKSSGCDGYPISSKNYDSGDTVNYDYTLKTGYQNLKVILDGNVVGHSGSFTMDKDRTLQTTTDVSVFNSQRYAFSVNNEKISDNDPREFKNTISLSGYIHSLKYSVSLNDNDISDLALTLISPKGTSHAIKKKDEGTGSGYSKSGSTSDFNKEQIKGDWKMRVEDGAATDTVRFGSWWIEFTFSTVPWGPLTHKRIGLIKSRTEKKSRQSKTTRKKKTKYHFLKKQKTEKQNQNNRY